MQKIGIHDHDVVSVLKLVLYVSFYPEVLAEGQNNKKKEINSVFFKQNIEFTCFQFKFISPIKVRKGSSIIMAKLALAEDAVSLLSCQWAKITCPLFS